nr:MAG TPA: hypothetical protein [Caudoviricetes sp.]
MRMLTISRAGRRVIMAGNFISWLFSLEGAK